MCTKWVGSSNITSLTVPNLDVSGDQALPGEWIAIELYLFLKCQSHMFWLIAMGLS